MPQATIAKPLDWSGVGLHSGRPANVRLEPSAEGGWRLATDDAPPFPVSPGAVRAGARATRLGSSSAEISTVEHLLAALSAMEVGHARIHVVGGEVPALDGSALPFVEGLRKAGSARVEEEAPAQRPIRLEETIEVRDGERFVRAEPAEAFGFRYQIEFDHAAIGRQTMTCERLTPETFATEIAPARTFGFLADLETLRAAGLAGGASLENTLVYDDEGPVGDVPLRFDDECVRHKALDLIGDLALLGGPLRAFVTAHLAGHRLHQALVHALHEKLSGPDTEGADVSASSREGGVAS